MFKIGKLENVKDENIDIKLVTQEQVKYRKGKKSSLETFKTLSFVIESEEYSFSFCLNTKLETLLKIPLCESIDFKDYICHGETGLNIKELGNIEPEINIKVIRYLKNKFIIYIVFYTDYRLAGKDDYSGMIEFEFDLDNYL